MSRAIYIKIVSVSQFYSTAFSEFLFEVVKEGCKRRIAIKVNPEGLNVSKNSECFLQLTDSYNYQLVTPLIGCDYDEEVEIFRPVPHTDRLLNLQGFLRFLLSQPIVQLIEIYLTMNADIEDLDVIETDIEHITFDLIPYLEADPELHYKIVLSL